MSLQSSQQRPQAWDSESESTRDGAPTRTSPGRAQQPGTNTATLHGLWRWARNPGAGTTLSWLHKPRAGQCVRDAIHTLSFTLEEGAALEEGNSVTCHHREGQRHTGSQGREGRDLNVCCPSLSTGWTSQLGRLFIHPTIHSSRERLRRGTASVSSSVKWKEEQYLTGLYGSPVQPAQRSAWRKETLITREWPLHGHCCD